MATSGKAGSLLIDIAANTAQLKKDMDEAKTQIAGLGRSVEGVANVVRGAFQLMVAREVINFIKELTTAVGDLEDKAKQVGLSTRDFQAFTIAMQQAGATASEVSNILSTGARFLGSALQGNKANIDLLNQLKVTILDASGAARPYSDDLQRLARAILSISDPLKQAAVAQQIFGRSAREVIPALEELARGADAAADKAGRAVISDDVIRRFNEYNNTIKSIARTLAADLATALDSISGGPAGNAAAGLEKVKTTFDGLGQAIRVFGASDAGAALGAVWGTFLFNLNAAVLGVTKLIELLASIPQMLDNLWTKIRTTSEAAQDLAKGLPSSDPGLSASGAGSPAVKAEDAERLRQAQEAAVTSARETAERIARIKAEADAREADRQRRALNAVLPPPGAGSPVTRNQILGLPEGGSNPPPTARGGGRGAADRFGDTLKGLQEQAAAVTAATKDLNDAAGLGTKEAERLAKLQIDIAQHTAAAIKSAKATDPAQKDQLHAAVVELDNAKFKFEELKQTLATADDVNRTFGDGTKQLADRLFYLGKALDAGKISQEEYDKATRAATEAQAIQAETAKGLTGGFDGIVAGWNKAALAAGAAGTEMKMGEQLFTQTFSLMSNAISEFVTTGQLDFGKLAESFAQMLAQMAIQWAAASFLRAMGMGASAVGGGEMFGPPAPAVTSGGMLASGGPVVPGRAYMVGEHGPERFIPRMPGTVVANNNQPGDVAVNVDMSGNNNNTPDDPRKTVEFARRVRAAVIATISDEKRPGGVLYVRQSQ
jgi:lambda family phage tail tape measure protein